MDSISNIGLELFCFLKEKGWEGNLAIVGADGCNVNTGHERGAPGENY